jgi:hypothetical protein
MEGYVFSIIRLSDIIIWQPIPVCDGERNQIYFNKIVDFPNFPSRHNI